MTAPSVNDIIAAFPEPVPRITGQPTYNNLKTLRNALKVNAGGIDSTLGGGQHGHLGLVLTPAAYNLIVAPPAGQNNAWNDPPAPPAHPQ